MKEVFHKTYAFARFERIKSTKEIKNLFREGKKTTVNGAKLFYVQNVHEYNRICFTFPRGYGTAVERNHSKRLSREAYRLLKNGLRAGYDLLLLMYSTKDSFSVRCNQIRSLCSKAGLLKS